MPDNTDSLLTETGVAEIAQVKPRTIKLWRETRGLPYVRITSKVIRFRRGDVDAWLSRHLVETVA